jgi:hypothetical protein
MAVHYHLKVDLPYYRPSKGGGGAQQTFQKPPQTSPNFLKIVKTFPFIKSTTFNWWNPPPPRYPRPSKGGPQEILQKLLPQTSPNFLKILENLFSRQKHYFRSIKTCFKKIWPNAKGDHRNFFCLKQVQTLWKLSKSFPLIKRITFNQSIKTCSTFFLVKCKGDHRVP